MAGNLATTTWLGVFSLSSWRAMMAIESPAHCFCWDTSFLCLVRAYDV